MRQANDQAETEDFVKSAKQGYASYVDTLLKKGKVAVDAVDGRGMTALYAAASAGKIDVVEVLIAAGADLNFRMPRTPATAKPGGDASSTWPRTALNVAASLAKADVVTLLLDCGADPRIVDSSNRTAAHHVMENCDRWLSLPQGADVLMSTIGRMLDYGVRINQVASAGMTLLHFAVGRGAPTSVLDFLYQRGASVDQVDFQHRTPLHHASTSTKMEALCWLVEHGADVNARTCKGQTALFNFRGAEMLDVLMDMGIQIDTRDIYGRTALNDRMFAHPDQPNASLDEIKLLIHAGADLDLGDQTGISPRNRLKSKQFADLKPLVAAMDARKAMRQVVRVAASVGPAAS